MLIFLQAVINNLQWHAEAHLLAKSFWELNDEWECEGFCFKKKKKKSPGHL